MPSPIVSQCWWIYGHHHPFRTRGFFPPNPLFSEPSHFSRLGKKPDTAHPICPVPSISTPRTGFLNRQAGNGGCSIAPHDSGPIATFELFLVFSYFLWSFSPAFYSAWIFSPTDTKCSTATLEKDRYKQVTLLRAFSLPPPLSWTWGFKLPQTSSGMYRPSCTDWSARPLWQTYPQRKPRCGSADRKLRYIKKGGSDIPSCSESSKSLDFHIVETFYCWNFLLFV